jgi:DNA-binding transcriptional regulator YiaG
MSSLLGEDALKNDKLNARKIRERRGLNQLNFWAPLGVTQSGGSRYEAGRAMPKPVQLLLGIVYLGRKPPKAP